ncbi:VWA domain-containing protein [bacterium]|nr:VWA domain-containing protein [bacterium]MBU1754513.1 VWA domain-containing protein [bacterium]
MIFFNPKHLLWLLVLVGIAVYDYLTGGKRLFVPLFKKELFPVMLIHYDERRYYIKKILFYAGMFFLIIAMAQPQWGKGDKTLSLPGMDVVFAIDVSKSMLSKDIKPNRLENAKNSLNLLIDQLSGNRLALVAFAGTSFIECPMTTDIGAVKLFLDSIRWDLIPVPGTDIGGAIQTAAHVFGNSTNSKAIILITDGDDLAHKAMEEAKRAKGKGIRIYPIGIGSAIGETVPEIDSNGREIGVKRDKNGEIVISRLNEALLTEIAHTTGGKAFFVRDKGTTLPELMAAIATLPKQGIKNSFSTEHKERFQIFIALSIICLMAEFVLSTRRKGNE